MKLGDPSVVNLPVVRFVFEDLQEFADLQVLANKLGMGRDWPMAMLRDYLNSYKLITPYRDRKPQNRPAATLLEKNPSLRARDDGQQRNSPNIPRATQFA